ncbi:MAG: hypothetical protein WCA78_14635 [Rhizomicrobium sp.]
MNRHIIALATVFAGACFTLPSAAQYGPTGPTERTSNESSHTTTFNLNSPSEIADKDAFMNKRKRLGLTPEQMRAQDMAEVTNLVNSAQFSCDVTNAQLLLEGSETTNGNTVKTKTFEATCGNGLGYFFVGRGQLGPLSGFTCFAANATNDADVKAHRDPDMVCTLPENLDMKAIATKVLLRKGVSCPVGDVKWRGTNSKSNTDYTEIACSDGNGFILASPLPGSTLKPQLVRCHDAAMQGIPCKLSDNGQVLTTQTFIDALAQHHVACDAPDVRVIGKEATKQQRHVVEFACKQHPEGLVAFIPLEGNTAPFETLDCAAAAKRGVACKLTPVK